MMDRKRVAYAAVGVGLLILAVVVRVIHDRPVAVVVVVAGALSVVWAVLRWSRRVSQAGAGPTG